MLRPEKTRLTPGYGSGEYADIGNIRAMSASHVLTLIWVPPPLRLIYIYKLAYIVEPLLK